MKGSVDAPISLPAGWKHCVLRTLADVFIDGNWIETKDQATAGIRLVQTGNIGTGDFKDRREKARFIDNDTFARLKCSEVHPRDILISRLPDPVGRACIVPDTGEKMITAVDCSIVRPKAAMVDPSFLVYYTQTTTYLRAIDDRCTGTTRRRISRKNLGKVPIPLPPLDKQKRIVAVLDQAFTALDRARACAEANLSDATAIFDSWVSAAFEFGDDHWPKKSLLEITENLDRLRVPITKKDRKLGDIPYYGASGVVDHVDKHLFDENLLLVSEDGANLLARTYPIAFSISGKSWVNNHAHVLRFEDMDAQEFVRLYLNSISLQPWVSGMAQPKLNQKALNSILIPYPDEKDRTRIVGEASKIWGASETARLNYQTQIVDIANLRQSLLKKAFSGQLT